MEQNELPAHHFVEKMQCNWKGISIQFISDALYMPFDHNALQSLYLKQISTAAEPDQKDFCDYCRRLWDINTTPLLCNTQSTKFGPSFTSTHHFLQWFSSQSTNNNVSKLLIGTKLISRNEVLTKYLRSHFMATIKSMLTRNFLQPNQP